MPDSIEILNETKDGLTEIINVINQYGGQQADTRKGAIQIINEMCDSLQLACDLISSEITKSIIEFNKIKSTPIKNDHDRDRKIQNIGSYFEKTALKYSDGSIRNLLHDGNVCGELHALNDRFTQPFSGDSTGSLSLWENIKTFFTRSNSMSNAIHNLHAGEGKYLYDFRQFIDDVKTKAEDATGIQWEDVDSKLSAGDEIISILRSKRETLQSQINELRKKANECIEMLH